jgi:hypothetical protein
MAERHEQVGDTPGTSSSRAFTDFYRQRSQGPSSNTRSHSAEAFQTPAQGISPLDDTLSSIAEEIDIEQGRRDAIINLPLPGPPDFEVDPDIEIDRRIRHPSHMMVTEHMLIHFILTFSRKMLSVPTPRTTTRNG